MEEYGRELQMPPEVVFHNLDVNEIEAAIPRAEWVLVDLWTVEEGRSDLTLEIRLTDTGGELYDIKMHCLQEPLPQVPVRHRLIAVVEPSVLSPLLVPTPPHAVDEVGGVGVDGHDVPLVYRLKGDARAGYLHPQVGGVLLTTADLLGLPIPIDFGTVASGPAGAGGCSVGVGVGSSPGKGTDPPAYPSSTHPFIFSLDWVPSSRTIRCSRSTSRQACWWSRSALARSTSRRRCSSVSSRPSR